MQQDWPNTLWVVRHGQSAGNVARDKAEAWRASTEPSACLSSRTR